jgi:uncharacterized protein YkwD
VVRGWYMRPIPGTHGPVVLRALLWGAAIVSLGWAQPSGQSPSTPSAQSAAPAAPNSASSKSGELGVWRHFGDSPSPPSSEHRQTSVWRHFGEGGNALPPPHDSPAWQNSELGGTREMEQLMLELVNRDRADPANMPETHGRALPLRWNERLAEVARAHSLDMLNQGYFGHEDRQGMSVGGRIEAAGMPWQAVGENIAIYPTASSAEAAFMNEPRFSKNHRGNILNPNFSEVGIGIVQAPDGRLYITQDFYTALTRAGMR